MFEITRPARTSIAVGLIMLALGSTYILDYQTRNQENYNDIKQEQIKDCDFCPVMVVVPAGTGRIGSNEERSAYGPAIEIRVEKPFAIGQSEVTVAQFRKCKEAGGCAVDAGLEYDPYNFRSVEPAVTDVAQDMISWLDARDYAAWLSLETGYRYRLPTEAEWEYAARAGSKTRFWWGEFMRDGMVNCRVCGDQGVLPKSKPGDFPANPFGLYHVHGNIREWVQDCWHGNHRGRSGTTAPRLDGDCGVRVFKGGSAQTRYVEYATTAYRHAFSTKIRRNHLGLRVVRELD